jgi:hypothetical protein
MDDLTIISSVMRYDGIGKHGYIYIKMLEKDLNINCLLQQPILFTGFTGDETNVIKVFQKPMSKSKVAFWVNILGLNESMIPVHQQVFNNSEIFMSFLMSIPDF